jgi:hypothetical protein
MATQGATTLIGHSAIFGEKPVLYPDVMDDIEYDDYQFSRSKEDPALVETAVRIGMSTDGIVLDLPISWQIPQYRLARRAKKWCQSYLWGEYCGVTLSLRLVQKSEGLQILPLYRAS